MGTKTTTVCLSFLILALVASFITIQNAEAVTSGFQSVYDVSHWTFTTQSDGSVDTSGASDIIVVIGGDASTGPDPTNHDYTIVIPTSGVVTFDWVWHTDDGGHDLPFFVLNGAATELGSGGDDEDRSGSESVQVSVGDVIAFRIDSDDDCCGVGDLTISNYVGPSTVGGDGDSKYKSKPTFGLSHDTGQQQVEKGFTANFKSVDITDNFHTDFEKKTILVGQKNTFSAKVHSPNGLQYVEFMFGIPQVGNAHQSETAIEVWLDRNGEVQNITVVQKDNIINTESVTATAEMRQCTSNATDKSCYYVTTSASFNQSPLFDVFALKGVDFTRRAQLTYLNEGFDIIGDPLNPPETDYMASGKEGLVQMIRFDKFEYLWAVPDYINVDEFDNLWVSSNGIIYTRNDVGSWFRLSTYTIENNDPEWKVMTRMHDQFSILIDDEIKRATLVFDGSLLLNEIPDYIPNPEFLNRSK